MRRPHDETLAVDSRQAELRPTPASLPFARPAAEGGVGGIPCLATGEVPVTLDTVSWRVGPALRLSVVMKVAFSVAPAGEPGPLVPAQTPPRFFPADVHFRNQPMAHPTAASDRVPWKSRVDVTLLGHAHAPRRLPAPEVALSFTALHGATVLFQRKARALGKRKDADAAPEPFVTMPVVYERAYGGPSTPTNPIGCGDDEDDAPPNIVDPDNAWRPAALGPLAAGWPLRHRKLKDVPRRALDAAVMTLPPDFDMSYFQSAPAEQQLSALAPGTSFVLEGFHPERARVEIVLPETRAAGFIYGLSAQAPDAPSALSFQLDTLHIDADNWLCTLVWRAFVDLPDEGVRERLLVAAAVAIGAKEPELPSTRPEIGATAPALATAGALHRGSAGPSTTGTLDIGAGAGASLPFGGGGSGSDATLALPTAPVAAGPSTPFAPRDVGRPPPPAAASNAPAPPIVASPPPVSAPVAPPSLAAPAPLAAAPAVAPPPDPAPVVRVAVTDAARPRVEAATAGEGPRLGAGAPSPARVTAPARTGPRPRPAGAKRGAAAGGDVARSESPDPAQRASEPYGQVAPWARGAEGGTDALAGGSGAAQKPRTRVERKFNLRKGFSQR